MNEIVIKSQKIRKFGIKEFFLHETPSKTWFWNGNHSLLSRADARGNDDIIYQLCDAYRYFAGQALLMTSQSRLRTEYLYY